MALVVQKFGGTAVAGPNRLLAVARRVAASRAAGDLVVVVVSAMGAETDELLDLATQVSARPDGRELDVLITAGERKSVALLSMALHNVGCPARSFSGVNAGIRTDGSHTQACILDVHVDELRASLERGEVPVVAGAQGVSPTGEQTFLGRGGSDTTAVALAHGLGAEACQLFTDVDGVYTADPRVVPEARRIDRLSYEEMLEMCVSGCPKPDSQAVEMARMHGVTIQVRSAFREGAGSFIGSGVGVGAGAVEPSLVSAVSYDLSEAQVTVAGLPARPGTATNLFRALAESQVNVDMIVQNSKVGDVTTVSFTTPRRTLDVAIKTCEAVTADLLPASVTIRSDIGKVSVIGAGLRNHPGVAAQMLGVLSDLGLDVELIGTSPIRMSCVIDERATHEAVLALHHSFGLQLAGGAGIAPLTRHGDASSHEKCEWSAGDGRLLCFPSPWQCDRRGCRAAS